MIPSFLYQAKKKKKQEEELKINDFSVKEDR